MIIFCNRQKATNDLERPKRSDTSSHPKERTNERRTRGCRSCLARTTASWKQYPCQKIRQAGDKNDYTHRWKKIIFLPSSQVGLESASILSQKQFLKSPFLNGSDFGLFGEQFTSTGSTCTSSDRSLSTSNSFSDSFNVYPGHCRNSWSIFSPRLYKRLIFRAAQKRRFFVFIFRCGNLASFGVPAVSQNRSRLA